MLKTSLFLHIEFKKLSLFRSQSGMDEKFKWASRKLFHSAYRCAQSRAVEMPSELGRKQFFGLTCIEFSQSFYYRNQRRRTRQLFPPPISFLVRAGQSCSQNRHNEFVRMLALAPIQ